MMTSRNKIDCLKLCLGNLALCCCISFILQTAFLNQFVLSTDSKLVGSLWGKVDKYFSRICSDSEHTAVFYSS